MSQNNNGKVILFIVFMLFIIIGGYFFTDHLVNKKVVSEKVEEKKPNIPIDLRIDKEKDYVYYDDDKMLIQNEEIGFQNIYINLNGQENLTSELRKENETLLSSIKYAKDVALDENKTYATNSEGIYSLNYREYEDNLFKDYLSINIMDYYYDIATGISPINLKSYVINKSKSIVISEDELLEIFNINWDQIKDAVKKRINDTQILTEGEGVIINIDETMNGLDKHSLTVSKNGKLKITFVVISNKNNYNDSIEIS